jgi:16S rRNA (guanine(1405)-N(7))-methyltransferase
MSDTDASTRVAEQVLASRRYRDVEPGLVRRFAADEVRRRATESDAVKHVKRRLHQAVGAYRRSERSKVETEPLSAVRAAWRGELEDGGFRAACRELLAGHASTRERLPYIEAYYAGIWAAAGGPPSSILDLGCGLGPLALPWMKLPRATTIHAIDVDNAQLDTVEAFLTLVDQPHRIAAMDLATTVPVERADMALLLKLVPLLDRQDPAAAGRLVGGLNVRHAVITFPSASLGGRGKGMERTYRGRMNELVQQLGRRVVAVGEASVPNELVFVLELTSLDG